jgi:acyl-coenzyme A synthetase/AMP-(fatty) acid ligase
MITSDIIVENLQYHRQYSDDILCKKEFVSIINRWKYMLHVVHGRKKGDIAAIAIMQMNINHIALLFALAELGMSALILDPPLTRRTMHKTKAALYAPIDFCVEDYTCRNLAEGLHHEMLEKYCNILIDESEIDHVTEEFTGRFNEPSDVFICSSTSGSTGGSKKIFFTQEEVYKITKRNIKVFKFNKDSRVAHTKNMHHASAVLTHLLPSLMVSENHFNSSVATQIEIIEDHIIPVIRKHKIDRFMLHNSFFVDAFVSAVRQSVGKLDTTILLNISGYTVPERYIEYCKQTNVEFISHFGQINNAIPLLINHVTADTVWRDRCLGVAPDDFYQIKEVDGHLSVTSELWDGKRIIDDNLEFIDLNGERIYFHNGRRGELSSYELILRQFTAEYALFKDADTSKFTVVFWEKDQQLPAELLPLTLNVYHLDKMTFTTETKVNMEQLGAYLGVR